MAKILPAVLPKDEKDLRDKAALAASFCSAIQIDVLDGTLFGAACWSDPERIASEPLPLPFDAHLMIAHPEKAAGDWVRSGAKRVIAHLEAPGNLNLAMEETKKLKREFGLALSPETDLSGLDEYVDFIDYILLLGVDPGAQGRAFHPDTVSRVRTIRQGHPKLMIGVDGSITDVAHLAHELAAAGADELIVGSSIWRSKDPADAYRSIAADAITEK